MYSTALARYNPDHTGSWAGAGGATIGTLVLQALTGNLIDPLSSNRTLAVAAAGAVGGVGGALVAAPPGQKTGTAVGAVAGLGLSYGIGKISALPTWLQVSLMILAVPAGAFAGSKF